MHWLYILGTVYKLYFEISCYLIKGYFGWKTNQYSNPEGWKKRWWLTNNISDYKFLSRWMTQLLCMNLWIFRKTAVKKKKKRYEINLLNLMSMNLWGVSIFWMLPFLMMTIHHQSQYIQKLQTLIFIICHFLALMFLFQYWQ